MRCNVRDDNVQDDNVQEDNVRDVMYTMIM